MPSGVRVCEYGSDELFVCCEYVFFGVARRGVRQSTEDVDPFLSFGVHIVCVCAEGHASVEGQAQNCGFFR